MASKRKQGESSPGSKASNAELNGKSKKVRVEKDDYKSWGVEGVSDFLSQRGFSSEICAKFISKFFFSDSIRSGKCNSQVK